MNEHIKSANRFIPKWDKENILYERNENGNSKIMISRKHPELQQLYYNQTTMSILELCSGDLTVEEIANAVLKKYKGVQYEKVLDDTINTIHKLWRLGFIVWIDENPFLSMYGKTVGEYHYSLLSEDQAVAWMEKNRPQYFTPIYVEASSYTETAIKQNTFLFYETFFQLRKQNEELLTFSLIIPLGNECFFKVGIMNYDIKEEYAYVATDFLKWACEKYKQLFKLTANAESVLCYVRSSDLMFAQLLKTHFGAVSVGTLHKELKDNSDIEIYQIQIRHQNM